MGYMQLGHAVSVGNVDRNVVSHFSPSEQMLSVHGVKLQAKSN